MIFKYDSAKSVIEKEGETIPFDSEVAFKVISDAWLRIGWDTKYVYSFQWFGRPIIQLPEDMVRAQEVIFEVKPDYIIETGVAHGGSLVYYASLLKLMDKKKIIGVEIALRNENRKMIESHFLSPMIDLVDGSSVDSETVDKISNKIESGSMVMVFLDSNHSFQHVLEELRIYSKFVTVGSYIVATDGIMKDVVGAPRTQADWATNNPYEALKVFLSENNDFVIEERTPYFNEGKVNFPITYWPSAYLKRIR